jgi:hypothetical protein
MRLLCVKIGDRGRWVGLSFQKEAAVCRGASETLRVM